jgi:hypothetical protein
MDTAPWVKRDRFTQNKSSSSADLRSEWEAGGKPAGDQDQPDNARQNADRRDD